MRRVVLAGVIAVASGCSLLLSGDLDGLTSDGDEAGSSGTVDGASPLADSTTGAGDGGAESGSVFAVEDAGLAAGDLRVYYARTTGELFTRTWTHTDAKWQPPVVVRTVGADRVPWVVPTISRFGSELVATLAPGASKGNLQVFSGAGLAIAFEDGDTMPNVRVNRRGVDVAHGSATGAGMVVYADDSAVPKFRRQTTAGWTEEAPIGAAAGGVASIDWIRLVAHPSTDEMTLLFTDTSRKLYGSTWDGNAWSTPPAVLETSGVDIDDFVSFAGAYESTTGNFLAVWSPPSSCDNAVDPLFFATKPSGSSAFAPVGSPGKDGLVAGFGPVLAASEPGTNRIAISAMEYAACCKTSFCNDWQALLWDGSWKPKSIIDLDQDPKSSYPSRLGTLPVEVAWLGTTGRAIAVYAHQSNRLTWATWTPAAGGWNLESPISFTPLFGTPVSYAMVSLPSVGALAKPAVALFVLDTAGRLWAKLYDGASWTDLNDNQPIADDVPATEGRSFGAIVR